MKKEKNRKICNKKMNKIYNMIINFLQVDIQRIY